MIKDPVVIPFPLSTAPGTRPQESAGRLINVLVEPLGKTGPARAKYMRAPGLKNFGTTARTGYRGAILVNDVLYSAFSGQLEKWSSSGGASTNVGALNGTKKGFLVANNAATPDKVFVDPDGNIATFTPSTVTNSYPDVDLPAVNSGVSINGYFVFTTGSGKAYATGLNTTAVDALSFGAAESKSDGLTRAINWGGQLLLMGPLSTEIWTDQGLLPFPFARSLVIPRGIAGPYCVTGFEDGFGRALCWVGDDNAVYRLNGYTPEKISSPDLDALIASVTDKTTLEMSCYVARGHALVQIACASFTWVFDLNNGTWTERISYNLTRSRIVGGIYAYGKWLCGDTATGNVQEISSTTYQEISNPLRTRLESGPVENFPVGRRVGRADFNFVTGVGSASGADPIETDPSVEISWSDDGGQNWTAPYIRKLGRQSMTDGLVSLTGTLGRSQWNGRRWRVDVADPVYCGFLYATQGRNPRVTG
jgi:hypothetical protein